MEFTPSLPLFHFPKTKKLIFTQLEEEKSSLRKEN